LQQQIANSNFAYQSTFKHSNMTISENQSQQPVFTTNLSKRMLIGAGLGLIAISIFVIGAGRGEIEWGNYWRVKPLLLTPFIGAIVGMCYDITERLRKLNGWLGYLFVGLSVIGYALGMWVSLVLGLAGTMWD
jgi:hypothetical protein